MLAIIDYRAGNQTSVRRALESLDIPCSVTADPSQIAAADGILFPGVGAAGQAMGELARTGLDAVLRRAVAAGQPLLGICLGCQILLERSEEDGGTETLGIVPGTCRRFAEGLRQEDGSPAPVPHMGWNSLHARRACRLLDGVDEKAEFYFVHGYYTEPAPGLVIATTDYGGEFCSVYGRDGLWAVQFHPEKSGRPGLAILRNFHEYCTGAHNAQ